VMTSDALAAQEASTLMPATKRQTRHSRRK
jgi:hypothetical protein